MNLIRLSAFVVMNCLILATIGCRKEEKDACEDDFIITNRLFAYERTKVPYTGDEILRFVNDKSDTLTLEGLGKNVYNKEEKVETADPKCSNTTTTLSEINEFSYADSRNLVRNFKVFLLERDLYSNAAKLFRIEVNTIPFVTSINNLSDNFYTTPAYYTDGTFINCLNLENDTNNVLYHHTAGIVMMKIRGVVWKKIDE